MIGRFVLAVLALAVAGCASVQEARINRYCGVGGGEVLRAWSLLPAEPANAAAYRAAATADRGGYHAPRGGEREYWFTGPNDATRVCVVGPGHSPCTGGWWDLRDTPDGPVDTGEGEEWICVS